MHIPKIVFEPLNLEQNIDLVKWAYFEYDDTLNLHKLTIDMFHELKDIDKNYTKEQIYLLIEKVVTKEYNKSIEKISKEADKYNNIWNNYNDKYFIELSKYLNVNWPKELKIINGFVGILPVCPRYLDTFDFCLSIDTKEQELIRICAHETCHFLWFEKWKNLYPNTPRYEYDSPYNTWKYSEMVVDPIINSNEINKILNVNEKAYDSFYQIKDENNNYMMEELNRIYKTNKKIEDKIIEGFNYINKIYETE